jgi:hypothetical protein
MTAQASRLEPLRHPARRPDERLPRQVLVIAGLLAHEHHFRGRAALAEVGLRSALP